MKKRKKTPKNAHDRARRLIFHHPRAVRDLVRSFVEEPWVHDLDFKTLKRVPSDSLTAMLPGEFEDRSNDVLWKVRWKKNCGWQKADLVAAARLPRSGRRGAGQL
jgi:hypothetical protein